MYWNVSWRWNWKVNIFYTEIRTGVIAEFTEYLISPTEIVYKHLLIKIKNVGPTMLQYMGHCQYGDHTWCLPGLATRHGSSGPRIGGHRIERVNDP